MKTLKYKFELLDELDCPYDKDWEYEIEDVYVFDAIAHYLERLYGFDFKEAVQFAKDFKLNETDWFDGCIADEYYEDARLDFYRNN